MLSFRRRTAIPALLAAAALLATPVRPALAQTSEWIFILNGTTPPNVTNSPGTGIARATLTGNLFRVQTTFSGLQAGVTVAHIHCCTAAPFTGSAGVATPTPSFPGFPAGVTAGSYDRTFDLTDATSWNAAFVTANGGLAGARAALIAGLNGNRAYFNVHSSLFPAGEINGFAQVVPEPSTYALMASGLAGLAGVAARRRRLRA